VGLSQFVVVCYRPHPVMLWSSIRVPFQVLVGEVARPRNDASLANCERLTTGPSAVEGC
jgi:hypothetical protein